MNYPYFLKRDSDEEFQCSCDTDVKNISDKAKPLLHEVIVAHTPIRDRE